MELRGVGPFQWRHVDPVGGDQMAKTMEALSKAGTQGVLDCRLFAGHDLYDAALPGRKFGPGASLDDHALLEPGLDWVFDDAQVGDATRTAAYLAPGIHGLPIEQ